MRALIFDTETTDLIANSLLPEKHQPRIIEFFGHIVEDDGTVVRELDFLCHPGHRLEKVTTNITGITDEMLKDAKPFSAFEGEVRALIGEADAVVAHNLSYDFDVVNFELKRCGTLDRVKWPAIRICTVQETEWFKGFRLNLSGLHEHLFGEPFSGAHRARVDVAALTRCYVELRKRGDL
jgi:DNA polymerase III epsilon subunit-like protein